MSENATKPTGNLDAAVRALRAHLLEKGNRFEHGPAYEGNGKVLASVKEAVRTYESLGYAKLFEYGDPPVYALMQRGHRETHLFHPQDPKIWQWLEDEKATLNDPALRAHQLQQADLTEADIPVAAKPQHYHINEVDEVFIVTTDD
ncbi:MAG: hypothetical protein WAV07_16520 [Candidatus Contendobacter sp.]